MTLEPLAAKFEKINVYETLTFFYLIGSDANEKYFRVLKFDRTVVKPLSLSDICFEDPINYDKQDLTEMLDMVDTGNKSNGGLIKLTTACGIVGLVKFLDCYYLTVITQKKKVGTIGGCDIHSVKGTEVIPIKPREVSDSNAFAKLWRKLNSNLNKSAIETAESRYMGLFQFVDISKDFFFSYDYDLTNSLQHNYLVRNTNRKSVIKGFSDTLSKVQDIFMWNHYQTEELISILGQESASNWIIPIVHGSFQQRLFSILGKTLDVILIARRNRYYAGTRYLKRGVNVHGKVANDCEVEQIMQTNYGIHTKYCSLLQVRGSIPTYWSQETSVTQPKPPIVVSRIDPLYRATQEHFSDLIQRYNLPIIALDLVKHEERRPREVIVGKEYRQALEAVNVSIPLEYQVRYIALDYSKISKSGKLSKSAYNSSQQVIETTKSSVNTLSVTASSGNNRMTPIKSGSNNISSMNDNYFGKEWSSLEQRLTETINDQQQNNQLQQIQAYNSNAGKIPQLRPNIAQQSTANTSKQLKIDLFVELDEIANYSLSETAFFCRLVRTIEYI